jgi:predicted transcriptional regulator
MKIRPGQDCLKISLFDLEAEIMEIIWNFQEINFTVTDVHQAISKNRNLAYTTIMTTVTRLYTKGLLTRSKEGRKYIYMPVHTRQEYIVQLTKEVIQQLPPIGQQTAVSMLIEHIDDADENELLRLEEMIRQKRMTMEDRRK